MDGVQPAELAAAGKVRGELEDLAFRYLEPQEYKRISEMVAARRAERERFVRRVERDLRQQLESAGITAEVSGRVKHLYSIRSKMRRYAAEGKSFDQIYVLTQGGPARATSVIVHYLYQNGFQFLQMGYAAAIAYVLFALLLAFTLLQWYYRRRWVFFEE